MKTKSAKAKGRSLQQLVVQKILATFPELTEHDVASTTMGVPGMDCQLSALARKIFPYALECRKQEALNIWAAVENAKKHAVKESLMPLVVFARNRTKPCVVLDMDDFFNLLLLLHRLQSAISNFDSRVGGRDC